jgi:hypothetical protein
MKNLDLNAYGVSEISRQEMASKNGGIAWGPVILGAILAGMI